MNTTGRNWPEVALGLGIIAAGLVIGLEANGMVVSPLYAKVGPAAFLWFAMALLLLCGALVAWNGYSQPAVPGHELYGPMVILAGLVLSVLILEPLGFVPTATFIFLLTAHGLGSRRVLRDAVIGFVLSGAAYLVFSKGLNLRLPAGTLFT